jgi:glycerol-3-phosphate dehydrogenase (NAD+)
MAAAATFLPATPTPRPRLAASFPSSRHPSPIFAGASATDAGAPEEDEDAGDIGEAAPRGGGKERRRAVRIAWEKLIRWSRSWRGRNRSDVLETTRKVTRTA